MGRQAFLLLRHQDTNRTPQVAHTTSNPALRTMETCRMKPMTTITTINKQTNKQTKQVCLRVKWHTRADFLGVPLNFDEKPWAYGCSNSVLLRLFSRELIFGGVYYWKEFCGSKWVGLNNKNSLKQLKTASTNRPSAYIREGLLPKGFLPLRFFFFGGGGLILSEFTVLREKRQKLRNARHFY